MNSACVIGIGNDLRGDDAAGLLAARHVAAAQANKLRVIESDGEPAALMDAWQDAPLAIVIDCCVADGPAGRIRRFEAHHAPLPAQLGSMSSHGIGLAEAIELARALDSLPPKLIVLAIEGRDFAPGAKPGPAVAAAAHEAAQAALRDLAYFNGCGVPVPI